MTILPLIDRELRVRARRGSVYWTRFAVALVGILICLPTIFMSAAPWGGGPSMLGQYAFKGLILTAFFLCCWAGLLTADSISRERREGTLALLFLTRIKAFDVLLGNFGAAGITCACALVACVPVLVLPVLSGGVTGGEACRTVLVLFDALFLSLTAGLWASARGRGWFNSSRSTVLLLACLIVLPALIGDWSGSAVGNVGLFSPLGALHYADDTWYRAHSVRYWFSIAVVQGISWLLLLAAGMRLRRAMGEGDEALQGSGSLGPEIAARTIQAPRLMADGFDPVAWLIRRQRGIKAVIWAGALIGIIYHAGWLLMTGIRVRSFAFVNWGLNPAVSIIQASLFGWAASRFFIEARRTGELELLLTTPLGAQGIVSSQWKALKRLLVWPLFFLVAVSLGQFIFYQIALPVRTYGTWPFVLSQLLSCANILVGTGALFWVGFWYGYKARSQAGAILRTVILTKGVSWVLVYLIPVLFNLLVTFWLSPIFYSTYYSMTWSVAALIVLLFNVWLIRWARRRLQGELAHHIPAPRSLTESISNVFSNIGVLVRKARRWPPGS